MPSLVCGMSVCPMSGPVVEVSEKSHCGGSAAPAEASAPYTMMFIDCMGIDLQQSSTATQIDEPSYFLDPISIGLLAIAHQMRAENTSFLLIRGPPFSQNVTGLKEPLYLVTRRIRL